MGILVKERVQEQVELFKKIHYLGFLGEEEKSLVDALPSQTLSSIQMGEDEQNQKYSSAFLVDHEWLKIFFLKHKKVSRKG